MDKSYTFTNALWDNMTKYPTTEPGLTIMDSTTRAGVNQSSGVYNVNVNTGEDPLGGYPYPSLYPWWHIILASVVVTVIIIVIILGNILVIVAIAKDNNLKGLQNWFIASLAVSDLLLGLLIMPLSLANELMGYWVFGTILCQLWLSIDVLLCTASILNLCLISLDRYWSITRAVSYVRNRTRKKAIIMITTVWLLSAIICFPPLVGWKRPQKEKFGFPLCSLSEEKGYVVYSTLGSFYIPLIVMVIVYFKIYIAARDRARKILKKKQIVPPHGGKQSTSTSSNTKDNHSPNIKGSFEKLKPISDSECAVLSKASSNESAPMSDSCNDAIKMSTVSRANNNKVVSVNVDEKRQLLCEDTDVTESECTNNPTIKARQGETRNVLISSQKDEVCEEDKITEDNVSESVDGEPHQTSNPPYLNIERDVKSPTPDFGEIGSPDSKKDLLSPNCNQTRSFKITVSKMKKRPKDRKALDDPERMRRKIARAKERRATIVLGVIMATFILCWLPFFSVYLISTLAKLNIPDVVFAVMFWAGYCNSALNPIIYTIFNRDFRLAFQRVIFGRRWGGYY